MDLNVWVELATHLSSTGNWSHNLGGVAHEVAKAKLALFHALEKDLPAMPHEPADGDRNHPSPSGISEGAPGAELGLAAYHRTLASNPLWITRWSDAQISELPPGIQLTARGCRATYEVEYKYLKEHAALPSLSLEVRT